MSFNLNAVLTKPSHGLTLDSVTDRLQGSVAADSARAEIVREPGAPPLQPPHIRFIWRETDMGTPGEWFAQIFLESGDGIREQNRQHVAESRNRCPQPDAVRAAGNRLRILFHDDPRNEFTNTIVELMAFLKQLPDAVVYDPQQNEFVV